MRNPKHDEIGDDRQTSAVRGSEDIAESTPVDHKSTTVAEMRSFTVADLVPTLGSTFGTPHFRKITKYRTSGKDDDDHSIMA